MRSLRYPILWESVSPDDPEQRDFGWADERLKEIRRLGMNPIVTLCHHGSGPAYTSLVEDSFATGLARHALAVAERFPWVRDYTPVNEPLTTARFSALYGYWYPHTQDEGLFWTALLNEIDATRLAMRAIRTINPAARLIQTDDLGYCHATPPLQSEADYQNERRWIGWDLLCGMVLPGHKLHDRIASFGLAERLRVIAEDPCPPDVIGINHYLASERLLDRDIERHCNRAVADRELGRCEGIPFVDVDAIRTRREGVLGLPALIRQAWQRYGRTISITECHNGATREEQIRWFVEVWNSAEALRDEGVDLCSVTAWSLLGSYDWHRMVTRFIGHYEPGVYDVRSGVPRPTAMAEVLRALAHGEQTTGPWDGVTGWWRRDNRFIDAMPGSGTSFELQTGAACPSGQPPLLIFGPDGTLTQLAMRACEARGLYYVRLWPDEREGLDLVAPWAVLDTHDRDGLCGEQTLFMMPEVDRRFAKACARRDTPLARIRAFRTDEHAPTLEIVTNRIYSPYENAGAAVLWLDSLDRGEGIGLPVSGTWDQAYGPDVIDLTLDLLLDGARGAHELRPPTLSEGRFVKILAETADADPTLLPLVDELAKQPHVETSSLLPPAESTIERFVRERRYARTFGEWVTEPDEAAMLLAAE
jgi:dTDP-4-dehydrorhamnose reductase